MVIRHGWPPILTEDIESSTDTSAPVSDRNVTFPMVPTTSSKLPVKPGSSSEIRGNSSDGRYLLSVLKLMPRTSLARWSVSMIRSSVGLMSRRPSSAWLKTTFSQSSLTCVSDVTDPAGRGREVVGIPFVSHSQSPQEDRRGSPGSKLFSGPTWQVSSYGATCDLTPCAMPLPRVINFSLHGSCQRVNWKPGAASRRSRSWS